MEQITNQYKVFAPKTKTTLLVYASVVGRLVHEAGVALLLAVVFYTLSPVFAYIYLGLILTGLLGRKLTEVATLKYTEEYLQAVKLAGSSPKENISIVKTDEFEKF